MLIGLDDITAKVRTAIDDVKGTLDDDFSDDEDLEIAQAVRHGVETLLETLPADLLEVKVIAEGSTETGYQRLTGTDGDGMIQLPEDFLRFVDIRVTGWSGEVSTLMEAGSEEELMQRSRWSRGTDTKPKAMLDSTGTGRRAVRYWPGRTDKELLRLAYIPRWTEADGKIDCALRPETERALVYLSAAVYLESKKEDALAGRMRGLAGIDGE